MIWLFVPSSLLLASCQTTPQNLELIRRSQPLLGTFVTISAYGSNREKTQQAVSEAFGEIQRIDSLMSLHRADSELNFLNSRGALEPVKVSPELFQVIAKAQEIAAETAGSFDITIRPLADLWGFIWKEYRMPTDSELEAVLPRVNYKLIEIDPALQTIRFLKPGVSIDLGGIGKGYAVDGAIEKLQTFGISKAMVKIGGDLRVIGSPPGKGHWTVQIEDPKKEGHRHNISLRDAALSTSGNYENFFTIKGKRFSHILNPRTGLPIQNVSACTVSASTCTESDAYATAFFVYGRDRTLEKFGGKLKIQFTPVAMK
ncbi:MAG: FAD:protein FMN transferase [Verrucomicrobiota bacterium]